MSFDKLGLSDKTLAAVAAAGFETPTPIQERAIPVALKGRDVLGIAQTGTGKTGAFVLPMLTRLENGRARARMPRTLIVEPTRELAAQVEESFRLLGQNHKLTVALLIGGVSFDEQNRKLDRGADVLIATPGRLLDHFERGRLLLTGVEILVIDEADRMLDMGFIPDVERICKLLPFTRQTLFFSATMPPEIQRLTETFLHAPERIEAAPPASAAETVTQRLIASSATPKDKRAVLRKVIRGAENLRNAIVFCNRKRDVSTLYKSLERHGFNVGALHGDMDQHARMDTLERFRNGDITLLVASDVAARGLDIPAVSHVFNYDVPTHAEDYVHRIGRTGRAGREGDAVMLVVPAEKKYLDAIVKLIGNEIEWMGEPGELEETAGRGRRGRRQSGDEGSKAAESRDKAPRDKAPRDKAPRDRAPGDRATRDRATGERASSGKARRESTPRDEGPRDRERQEQSPRDTKSGDDTSKPKREARAKQPRPRDGEAGRGRRKGRGGDTEEAVVGLGDHVPAFLLRPVRKDG